MNFSGGETQPPITSEEGPSAGVLPGSPLGSEAVLNPYDGKEAANEEPLAGSVSDSNGPEQIPEPEKPIPSSYEAALARFPGSAPEAAETSSASSDAPPEERGRGGWSDSASPEEVAAAHSERTKIKEAEAERLRQTYWEIQEANPELTPEQAVEVARDIYAAEKIAEKEGERVMGFAAETPAETPVAEGAQEESRGYEAYQRRFAMELMSEVAKLTPEQRVEAGWKAANLGFQMEKHKNQQFENIFRGIAKTIGGIGASEGRQNFMGRMLNAIADQYTKKAERNDRTIQSIEKLAKTERGTSILTKLSNVGLLAGNLNRVAQIVGLSVVPGGAALALGAMAGASLAEAGKESRLTSEAAMEKTRYSAENLTDEEKIAAWQAYQAEHPEVAAMTQEEQSVLRNKIENDLAVDKAWEEAKEIYETAMKNKSEKLAGDVLSPEEVAALDPKARAEYQAKMNVVGETINAQDLTKAYEERIVDTLAARIEKFQDVEPGTNIVSRFMTKAAGWMMERAVASTQKKLEEIENSGLTTEEKNQRREEVMNRFGRGQLMKDLDRMLSQKGALDTMGALLWGAEKAAKAAVAAISIKNLYDMGQRFFGGPAPLSQESTDRFVSGGNALRASEDAIDAQNAQESIDQFGAEAAAIRAADNATDAANAVPFEANFPVSETVPGYTVVAGDNLTKIFSRELPELQGLSPAEQERAIQTMLRSMTPEQLIGLGVKSGNADLIRPGETLDMAKFNEFIAAAKTGGGGGGNGFASAISADLVGATGGTGGGVPPGGTPNVQDGAPGFAYVEHDVGPAESSSSGEAMPPATGSGYTKEQEAAPNSDWNMRDGGSVQTKTAEQVVREYQHTSGDSQSFETRQVPRAVAQPVEHPQPTPRSEVVSGVPRMARVSEGVPLSAGIPEQYLHHPKIQTLLSMQELQDRKFENDWQRRFQSVYDAIERNRSRQSGAFVKPFERGQENVTRGIFDEIGRAIGRGNTKGLGNRIEGVFQRSGEGVFRDIGREVANMPRNAQRAGETESRLLAQLARLQEQYEAAKIAHELRQSREIHNAIERLERKT